MRYTYLGVSQLRYGISATVVDTPSQRLLSATLPEKLAWMAASKFLLDAAIRFKLGRAPLSESLTHSNSTARAFGHQV
ncbi:hypothetical protein PCANC_24175 [Puccinia coronata f. sp. avenae]|uniref:Uncharacterized protein n=1 Tax=Puccinia coronata f. sp. avenae TaxID=200324 RepID=A0A2N5TWZ1_9BASI|nr:hypothetical protein PCANC_24175 [Puccinia coronata f. sp. avenae]